jgi:hypothetical protein
MGIVEIPARFEAQMSENENPKGIDVGVIILGSPGQLRNSNLENLQPNVRFSPPVYIPADTKPMAGQLIKEFLLNGRFLNRGERGCSQAHINIRQEIQDSPFTWTLVLEDDVDIPQNWYSRICDYFPGFPDSVSPSLILLNTNPYFNLGSGPVKLSLQPSLTNAYLVHKSALMNRKFKHLDCLQIADWPCSFSNVSFWHLSDLVVDLKLKSTIGPRPKNRFAFLVSSLLRGVLSPLIASLLKIPVNVYFFWNVLGPIKRDLVLRFAKSSARARSSAESNNPGSQ